MSARTVSRDLLQWLARQPWFDGRLGVWDGYRLRAYAVGHLARQAKPGPTAWR